MDCIKLQSFRSELVKYKPKSRPTNSGTTASRKNIVKEWF